MANAFLTPNNLLDAIPELANEDYVEAQTLGRLHGNCTQYYDACPISIFQVSSVRLGGEFLTGEPVNNW